MICLTMKMYWESLIGSIMISCWLSGRWKGGWNMSHVKNQAIQLSRLLKGWFAVSLCTECWVLWISADRVNKHELSNKSRSISPGASEFHENQKLHSFILLLQSALNVFQPRSSLFVKSDTWRCCRAPHVCSETWKSNVAWNGLISQQAQLGWMSR